MSEKNSIGTWNVDFCKKISRIKIVSQKFKGPRLEENFGDTKNESWCIKRESKYN